MARKLSSLLFLLCSDLSGLSVVGGHSRTRTPRGTKRTKSAFTVRDSHMWEVRGKGVLKLDANFHNNC